MQKGVVDLRNIISLRQQRDDVNKPFILEIVTKERVWKFSYKNQKELDAWFSTVQMLREDEVGLKSWIPTASEVEQVLVLDDSDDEETKEDLIAIEKEQTQRGETVKEIESIQEKINDQAEKKKRREQNMEKTKIELKN